MIPNINNLISVDLLQRFKNKFIEYIVTPIVGQLNEISNKIPAEASSSNQLADKAYVTKEVSKLDTLTPVVKNRLPSASEQTMKKLYLIPSEDPESLNTRDEYITVKQKVGWLLQDVIGELFEKPVPTPTGDNIAIGTTDDFPLCLIEEAAIDVGALVLNKEESIEWDGELESAAWDRAIAFYDEDTGGIGFMRAEVGTVYESESDGLNYILTSQGWVDVDSIPASGENYPILTDAYSYSWEKIGSTAMSVDYNDLKNKPTKLSQFTNDVGYLTTHQDISGKEDTTLIEMLSTVDDPICADVRHYYTFDDVVNTLNVELIEDITGLTRVQTIVFFMIMGNTPTVTFTSCHSYPIYYQDDFGLEAGKAYEVKAFFNGSAWVIESVEINMGG